MVTDVGLIVVSIISVFGMVTLMFLSQHNYFKKKTFLHKLTQQRKIDSLKLKQLKKEMGVNDNQKKDSDQNLDLNSIIKNIAGNYNNEDAEEEDDNMLGNIIKTVAENNPELVSNVLGRFSKKTEDEPQQEEIKYLGGN